MTLFDPVDTDVVGQLDRGPQSPQCRYIGTANALKSFGANLRIVPAFGRDRVPHPVNHFIADIEESRSLRRLKPLVQTGRIEIAPEVMEVETHHAGRVCAIGGGENAFTTGQGAPF